MTARPARLRLELLEDRCLLAADPFASPSQLLITTRTGDVQPVKLEAGASIADALAGYLARPDVLAAEIDHVVGVEVTPDDTRFTSLWGLHNTGQTGGYADADIDAPEAWAVHTGNLLVTVAVIDTGIDYTHPDLYKNIWINQSELPAGHTVTDTDADGRITFWDLNHSANAGKVSDANGNGRIDGGDLLADSRWANGADNDGNGKVDDLIGWDFVNNDNNPYDDNSHGTHVAGTIGGMGNNALGVAGVNWKVQIAALKFLSASGSGYTSAAVDALNYAVAEGIPISNNSWGGGGYSTALATAIGNARSAGHIFVAAAGNSARNNDIYANYPSNYNFDNVLAVASTDSRDLLSSFSNYGPSMVDLAAPGSGILSTVPGGGYASYSGTSMATPHVAGVAALVWSRSPTLSYNDVIARILNNVDPVAALAGKVATGGRLNAFRALTGSDLDTTAPRLLSAVPSGTAGVNKVRLTFSEAIAPASFTTADVIGFIGPFGSIAVTGVQAVAGSNNTQFDVTFATQTAAGSYRFDLGPDVTDLSGNRMAGAERVTFMIAPSTTFTNNTRVAIRDFRTAVSRITVNQDLTISDLNVRFNINHTWDGDLYIFLRGPDGSGVELVRFRGRWGNHFRNTTLDDEATTAIGAGQAPFAGSFRPERLLSAFDGKNARGTWTLFVYDGARYDIGALLNWSLVVSSNPGSSARGVSVDETIAPVLPPLPALPPAGLPTESLGPLAAFLATESVQAAPAQVSELAPPADSADVETVTDLPSCRELPPVAPTIAVQEEDSEPEMSDEVEPELEVALPTEV